MTETLGVPAFAERLPAGSETFAAGPKEIGELLRADYDRLGRLVAEIGLKAD